MRVRIPFVVSPTGKWAAYGYPSAQKELDWSMVEEIADNGEMESTYQRGWITVDLPVPKSVVEVQGDATAVDTP